MRSIDQAADSELGLPKQLSWAREAMPTGIRVIAITINATPVPGE